MVTEKQYAYLIHKLASTFGLSVFAEHKYVNELFEGGIPLFKLILAKQEHERNSIVIVSFHIEMDPAIAVEWHTRIEGFHNDVHLTASYIRDPDGNTHVAEDAEMLRVYLIQQAAIEDWIEENKDDLGIETDVETKPELTKRTQSFVNKHDAIKEFYAMKRKKDDPCH